MVHRDLKPANILVTADGRGEAARLRDREAAGRRRGATARDTDAATGFGLMTPEYASPEQVRGEAITVASDVYSLGVLLYELLAGRRPYRVCGPASRTRSSERSWRRRCRRPRPSHRTVCAVAFAAISTDIALTALRKDPAQRYPSAEALRHDLRRHLTGLPVAARPNTWRYRAGKFRCAAAGSA